MNRFALAISAALIASASITASAATITQWNFNSVTPDANTATGTTLPSLGAGSLTLLGGVTSAFNSGDASGGSSDPATGDDSGLQTTTYAAQGTGNKTRGVQYNVSTAGFSNIVLKYDLRHSNTSARDEQVQYSIDGTTFIDVATFAGATGDTWFNGRTVDLSSIAGVANNANFAFRVVAMFAPGGSAYVASNASQSYATTGTWRFDMVTVSGSPVPVPAALPLLASALGLVAVRRRRQAA